MSNDKPISKASVEANLPRDYRQDKAHIDSAVLKQAETFHTNAKLSYPRDQDVMAIEDERNKMVEEGIVPKAPHKDTPNLSIEMQQLLKEKQVYLDNRGHKRKFPEGYFLDVVLLHDIVKMHPLIKGVSRLVTVCGFKKNTRQRMYRAKSSVLKRLTTEQFKRVAQVLDIEDWKILIDQEKQKSYGLIDKLSYEEQMQEYKEKIKKLESKVRKLKLENNDEQLR